MLDVLLDSETVPTKAKRAFVQSFIGGYHLLVDDRIGSRVGDRCFAFADTFLKVRVYNCVSAYEIIRPQEKIGRSLIPHEQFLAGSYYGKFFSRNLNLYLLKRRPDDWKTFQSNKKAGTDTTHANTTPVNTINLPGDANHPTPTSITNATSETAPLPSKKKRKREAKPKDEIDQLFDSTPYKKSKSDDAATAMKTKTLPAGENTDRELKDVFSAIRAAPKTDTKVKKGRPGR